MRVAVVHSFYSSATPSGENQVVLDQVAALSEAGYDVRLFRRDTDVLERAKTYQATAAWTTVTGRGAEPPLSDGSWSPDVVHLHNTFPNWGSSWAARWRQRLVLTLHNYRTVCAAGTLFRDGHACHECLATPVKPAVRHACYRGSRLKSVPLALATRPGGSLNSLPRTARRVIALNDQAQGLFASTFQREIDLVPNFVDIATLEAQSPSGWAFIGRLDDAKGIVRLIQNWPAALRLHVFGSGPATAAVSDLARASGGSVTYHGVSDREGLMRRLPSFTGLIVPSLWSEGLPTVVLEALAAGVPLVMADPIAAARSLEDAGASITYDPYDVASLPAALANVTTRREHMSRAAGQVHAANYSRDAWLSTMARLYTETLEPART